MSPYEEVRRPNDVGLNDACSVPVRRETYYKNPIELWCEGPRFVERYGERDAREICEWAKSKVPLDPRTDEMLPDWAVDIMNLGRIGYKGRIRIIMTHANDILKHRINKNKGMES